MGSLMCARNVFSTVFMAVFAMLLHDVALGQPIRLSSPEKRGPSFVVKENLTNEEKDFFWRRASVDAEGFIRIAGSADQLNIITEALNLPFVRPQVEDESQDLVRRVEGEGYPYIASWREDDFRRTFFFRNGTAGRIMLTVYEFERAGTTVAVAKQFARFSARGNPAVLTLTTSENPSKALWKLSTWKNGVGYELYLEDELSARGKPNLNPHDILRLIETVVA